MVRANIEAFTQLIRIGDTRYCAYCGKEMKPDIEIDHGDRTDYWHCDCPDALEEIRIQRKVDELEREARRLEETIPKPKYRVVQVNKFEIQKID